MKLVFYYDYICPFCSLATDRILNLAEEFSLEIQWTGVEIHPRYPAEGKKRRKTEKTVRVTEILQNLAADTGSETKLPGFVTNSRLCLEAAEFAKEKNRFLEFHKACYEAYFGKGKNIGLLETVIEIACESGLCPSELREALEKKTFSPKIEKNMESAAKNMVFGVPTLYLGTLRIHGIQSAESYRKLITKQLARKRTTH